MVVIPLAEENLKKHGVGPDEALTAFADPSARIFDDPGARWIVLRRGNGLGLTRGGRSPSASNY
jgi:uncharacterized DUF497 family protein